MSKVYYYMTCGTYRNIRINGNMCKSCKVKIFSGIILLLNVEKELTPPLECPCTYEEQVNILNHFLERVV